MRLSSLHFLLIASVYAVSHRQPASVVNKNKTITEGTRPASKIQQTTTHLLVAAESTRWDVSLVIDALCTWISTRDHVIGHLRWEN